MYIHPNPPLSPPATTTPTSLEPATPILVQARQVTSLTAITGSATPAQSCPASYTGGALAGAILGTFFGTILLIYLFSVIRANALRRNVSNIANRETIVVEKRTSGGRRHRSHSHGSMKRPSQVYSVR